TPRITGPKKGPRLPLMLMNAKPAAALAPVRNDGGKDQNGTAEPKKLTSAMQIGMSAHDDGSKSAVPTNPIAIPPQPQASTRSRCGVRSVQRLQSGNERQARNPGSAAINPVFTIEKPMERMMSGRKMSAPNALVPRPRFTMSSSHT